MELKCFGVGVVTADAEMRTVGENKVICSVNLAFNRSYKVGDEWKKETSFMKAQVWGSKAERLAEAKKGTILSVDGYIKQDAWTDQDGQKRTAHVLNLVDFQECVAQGGTNDQKTNKKTTSTQNKTTNKAPVNKPKPVAVPPVQEDDDDDAPPF